MHFLLAFSLVQNYMFFPLLFSGTDWLLNCWLTLGLLWVVGTMIYLCTILTVLYAWITSFFLPLLPILYTLQSHLKVSDS